MTKIIDGKKISEKIKENIKQSVEKLSSSPKLAVILVGNDPASSIYVKKKGKVCISLGMLSEDYFLPASCQENELLSLIEDLNTDSSVHGILVQLPLPKQINTENILLHISPEKDVDGFHPVNVGHMLCGYEDTLLPCTPHGIKKMLEAYNISVEGKHVVIVGRSNIVGKPCAAILVQKKQGCNASVSIVHSRSEQLQELCLQADILIAAMGQAKFIKKDHVKKGATVIDVGIHRIDSQDSEKKYEICGDVDFQDLMGHCAAISPVPGGVGPMTIAMLMQNTLLAYEKQKKLQQSDLSSCTL